MEVLQTQIIHMPIFWCLVDPPKTCIFVGLIKPCHLLTGLFWDAVDSFAGLFDRFCYILTGETTLQLTNSTIFHHENLDAGRRTNF